jgi:hypothetical protein
VRAIATRFGLGDVHHEALRKRLERWRKQNLLKGGWQEVQDRVANSPRYVYELNAVHGLVKDFLAKIRPPSL